MKRMLLGLPVLLSALLLVGFVFQSDLSAGPSPSLSEPPDGASLLTSSAISETALYLPTVSNGATPDGGQTTEPPSGDQLSAQERHAAIQAIQTRLDEVLPPADTPVEQRNLLAEVVQLGDELLIVPGVIATVVQTQTLTVHAILSDGLPVTIINNRPPESTLPAPASDSAVLPAAVDAAAMSTLPGSGRAVVANFDGGAAVAASVRSQLSTAGYEVLSLGASINAMRNYRDLGALYLDTHGASFLQVNGIIEGEDGVKRPDIGDSVFALQTSTAVSASVLENLIGELSNGSVVVAFTQGDGGWTAKLAVTEKFIASNWTFDNGIVMIHACFAGSGPFIPGQDCNGSCAAGESGVFDPAPLRNAMLAAGAQVVVSYDNYTNANFAKPSILYFFDRLLGADQEQPQNPPLRPFDWAAVQSDMSDKGLLSFTKPSYTFFGVGIGGSNVNLTFEAGAGEAGPLAPSIQYFDVIDDKATPQGKIEVHGHFGEEQGTAEVDGMAATVESWTKDKVTIQTPFSGPGAAGDLILKSPGNVESNAAPVTEWRGTIKFSHDPGEGSLRAEAEMDVRFRADVHSYRESIDAAPKTRVVETYISPASEGTTTASGFVAAEDGTTLTWSGGGTLNILPKFLVDIFAQTTVPGANALAAQDTSSSYGGIITLDPEQNKARICLTFNGLYDSELSSAPGKMPASFSLTVPDLVDSKRGTLSCIDVSLSSDFSIPSGSRSASVGQASYELEWSKFEPVSGPSDQTPG